MIDDDLLKKYINELAHDLVSVTEANMKLNFKGEKVPLSFLMSLLFSSYFSALYGLIKEVNDKDYIELLNQLRDIIIKSECTLK